MRVAAVWVGVMIAAGLAACGGSNGSGSSSPPPPTGGGTTSANPCTAALASETAEAGPPSLLALGAQPVTDKKALVDGDPRGRLGEALWLHRARVQRERPSAVTPAPVAQDIGDIAVLQDQGDIVLPANAFDLGGTGLRFTRSGSGYSVAKASGDFRSALGQQLTLGDDDSAEVDVPFAFAFFGGTQRVAFVNSDGNVTFGEEDKASTERNVSRVLTGPPRVAPFLSDLDPTTGGKIFVNAASDAYTVTWCSVRGFDSARTVTAQVTLLPDGAIEMKYATGTSIGDAVVAVGPGRTGDFTPIDLSVQSPASGTGAIGERFAQASTLDTVAAATNFFASHPDNYDQILFWTDQQLVHDAFSYELTVANEVRGIGQDVYDDSGEFGSHGHLRSVVVMDWVGKFPDDPTRKFLGENNTLSVMGQEVGHRWLAYMNFRDHTGATSDALLGRDLAHWSFFFNSEASVMEGNEITDLGGGQFKTTDAVKRYSHLDQYAMGLIPASAVPTMFYVEAPNSSHQRGDAPQVGVTFTGTRRDLLINDIIAVNGDRAPSAAESPRTHRQAFIYIVSKGRTLDTAQVAKLDTIRRQWEPFFLQATEGRMTAVTTLK